MQIPPFQLIAIPRPDNKDSATSSELWPELLKRHHIAIRTPQTASVKKRKGNVDEEEKNRVPFRLLACVII